MCSQTRSSSQHGCALVVRVVNSVVSYLFSLIFYFILISRHSLSFDLLGLWLCLFLTCSVWLCRLNYWYENGDGNIRANVYEHGYFSNKQAKDHACTYVYLRSFSSAYKSPSKWAPYSCCSSILAMAQSGKRRGYGQGIPNASQ